MVEVIVISFNGWEVKREEARQRRRDKGDKDSWGFNIFHLTFLFLKLLTSLKKFKIDDAKVCPCVCVRACVCVCMCMCPLQAIPWKLLQSSLSSLAW